MNLCRPSVSSVIDKVQKNLLFIAKFSQPLPWFPGVNATSLDAKAKRFHC